VLTIHVELLVYKTFVGWHEKAFYVLICC